MLRKYLIFTFVSLFISAFVFNAAASPRANISGANNGVIDLGKVKEGQIQNGSFAIENSGDNPLILKSIQPSCGCVKVIQPKNEVEIRPGQKIKVFFSFNSTGYKGKTDEYLFLETNDPGSRILRVKIISDVEVSTLALKKRFLSFTPLFIIGAGLIDGINPCAFTVIVFFMSFLFFVGYSRKQIFMVGSAFILAVFLTYLLIGLGFFGAFRHLGAFVFISRILYYLTAAVAFILGFLSFIDFWRYKKTKNPDNIILKLPEFLKKKITKVINQSLDQRKRTFKNSFSLLSAAFSCGVIISLLESACTGQMYLPTIVFMLKEESLRMGAVFYLILYNLMFIFPLVIIFLFAGFGMTSVTFSRLASKNIAVIKLATAVIFILLGILLLVVI